MNTKLNKYERYRLIKWLENSLGITKKKLTLKKEKKNVNTL